MIEGKMGNVDQVARNQKVGVTGDIQMRKRVGADEVSSFHLTQWECLIESLR